MKYNPDKALYLDTNYLAAYLFEMHPNNKLSRLKMVEFLEQKKTMCVSCLTLDETLLVIKETIEKDIPKLKRKSIKTYYEQFKKAFEMIVETPVFAIIQFENDIKQNVLDVVENIKNYGMQPRDAFHLALMKDHNLNTIVTNDKKFKGIDWIYKISF